MGRGASGVRGIRLANDSDEVVGMVSVNDFDTNILVVSENGYGKRSSLDNYRITNRGGKGVKTISVTEKTFIWETTPLTGRRVNGPFTGRRAVMHRRPACPSVSGSTAYYSDRRCT